MTAPSTEKMLAELDALVEGLSDQQAMPDESWRASYAAIRDHLSTLQERNEYVR